MTSEPQRPPARLSVRRGLVQDEALYPGVPGHLRVALSRWAHDNLAGPHLLSALLWERRREALLLLAAECRIPIRDENRVEGALIEGLLNSDREDEFLDVIDMHLQRYGGGSQKLEEILQKGGSAWTVGSSGRLEHRVLDEQRQAFEDAVSPADSASDLLRKAWSKAYGRHPDPTGAWADAVKAVEVLMKPVVSPQDDVATLGKMIPALIDAPQKWRVTLLRPKKRTALEALVDMLRLIYPNPGRHDDENPATQTEAEQAVSIAVTLVSLLRQGVLSGSTT